MLVSIETYAFKGFCEKRKEKTLSHARGKDENLGKVFLLGSKGVSKARQQGGQGRGCAGLQL